MGGSGGGSVFGKDPQKLLQQLRESQEKSTNQEYEAKANGLLGSYLAGFSDRDVEGIGTHLDEIKKAIEKEISGTVDLKFGGSIAKHTYIDGLSDVDSLVMLNGSNLENLQPAAVKEYFAARLRERFPKTEVKVGDLAVTVKFSDAVIQLLPALSQSGSIKIQNSGSNTWSAAVRPKEFAVVLSALNANLGMKVVPAIKLAKAIVAGFPEKFRVTGYHCESLAVEVFKGYKGGLSSKELLKHFFAEGSKRVLHPIVDKKGQSVHTDDYLGKSESLERRLVADALARVARRMGNADSAGRLEDWKRLFGE